MSGTRAARQRVPPDERQTGALAKCLERSDLRALLRALLVSLAVPALIFDGSPWPS